MTLDPWSPLVLTRAPEPIPKLRVESPVEAQPGRSLIVTLRNESPLPEGAFRIDSTGIRDARGQNPTSFTREMCGSNPHLILERFHLAYNDPKGRWKINAHDLMDWAGFANGVLRSALNSNVLMR